MAIANEDKCPQCGTPYMSMLDPNDIVDTRICSTCEAEQGNAAFAANLGDDVDDELTLQGFDENARDKKVPKKARIKGGNLRQQMMADVRSKARSERMTAVREQKAADALELQAAQTEEAPAAEEAPPAPAANPGSSKSINPASRSSARGIPALPRASGSGLRPATRASGSNLNAVARASGSGLAPATRASGSGMNSATRASASGQNAATRSGRLPAAASPAKNYVMYGIIGVVVLVGGIIAMKVMGKSTPPQTASAPVDPPKSEPTKTVKEPKVETPPEKIAVARVVTETATAPTPVAATEPAAPEKAPEAKQDVADVLGLNSTRKSSKANLKEDDEPAPANAPAAAANPANADKPVEPGVAEKPPAAKPAEKPMGLSAITKKKPEEEPEPEKLGAKPPPPPVPVTAAEPTIVPLDIQKLDMGPERSLSESAQSGAPGWRFRDVNVQNSSAGTSHRGRDKVMVLNPPNEKLPAKLIGTIEIPRNFGGRRPMLVMEVASKDGNKDWVLSAKVRGIEIFKSVIKTKDELPWIEQGADLTALAGQRFELTIEAATKQKKPKDMKEEIGYIRNIRLEWSGKAKPAAATPGAKKP